MIWPKVVYMGKKNQLFGEVNPIAHVNVVFHVTSNIFDMVNLIP